MQIFPADLTKEFHELQSAGLVISPWLAGVNSNGRFDAGVFEMLDSESEPLSYALGRKTNVSKCCMMYPLPPVFRVLQSTKSFHRLQYI